MPCRHAWSSHTSRVSSGLWDYNDSQETDGQWRTSGSAYVRQRTYVRHTVEQRCAGRHRRWIRIIGSVFCIDFVKSAGLAHPMVYSVVMLCLVMCLHGAGWCDVE